MATAFGVVRVEWYQRRRSEQLAGFERDNPAMAAMLREMDALYLFGTLGMEAVMRSDGVVLVAVDEHWGEPGAPEPEWREASPTERTLSLTVARERWPELSDLLPRRPVEARDCSACEGRGSIVPKVYCGECGALGWIEDRAI